VDVAGFSPGSSYADKLEKPKGCVVAQHTAVCGFFLPSLCGLTGRKSEIYHYMSVCGCAVYLSRCCVWACSYMHPSVPEQTSGLSVLIILKLLDNAINHYHYHKLNMQNTHLASYPAVGL